ncbi:uncharacterized protein [Physcomitrium patens]|uniref:uncharacterized protein isoform X1 n=1 Tax=Physcomitrium patens TaxID=3218 RepID=UPI000D16CFB7|nr:uncharacterized protein LOC112285275 isoform X1 [Physcomitrium patens]|eukprot:XP_024381715.1 uncharacterized protein LOC112285275 isoform X1 [Physcomitrella patens]
MREKLARAVLRDLRQQGHEHVELRRDGVTAVFYCALCGTRCYNDSAIADHLNGKGHARHYESVRAEVRGLKNNTSKRSLSYESEEQSFDFLSRWDGEKKSSLASSEDGGVKLEPTSSWSGSESKGAVVASTTTSTTSLKWIGSGELFLRSKATGSPFVEASWFSWQGMYKSVERSWNGKINATRMEYALVVFPYSNGIGRGGDWSSLSLPGTKAILTSENKGLRNGRKPGVKVPGATMRLSAQVSREFFVSTETSLTPRPKAPLSPLTLTMRTEPSKLVSGEVLEIDGEPVEKGFEKEGPVTFQKIWKRKQAKNPDRICFICHQRLPPSQDVAALVNVKSGQMICGSRNRRGNLQVFHVFHSACLIEWVAFCEAKTWNASLTMSRKLKRRKTVHLNVQRPAYGVDGGQDWCGTETEFTSETSIFCPECQGTGIKLEGSHLERPRFRLNQLYEWVMELIESRKAYMDEQGNPLGLLFVKQDKSKPQVFHLWCCSVTRLHSLLFRWRVSRLYDELYEQGGCIVQVKSSILSFTQ